MNKLIIYILIITASFLSQCNNSGSGDSSDTTLATFLVAYGPDLFPEPENGLCPSVEELTYFSTGANTHNFTAIGEKLYFMPEPLKNENISDVVIVEFNENPGQDVRIYELYCRGDTGFIEGENDSGTAGAMPESITIALKGKSSLAIGRSVGVAENKSGSGSVDFTYTID